MYYRPPRRRTTPPISAGARGAGGRPVDRHPQSAAHRGSSRPVSAARVETIENAAIPVTTRSRPQTLAAADRPDVRGYRLRTPEPGTLPPRPWPEQAGRTWKSASSAIPRPVLLRHLAVQVSAEGHRTHRELGGVFSGSSAFFLCLEPPAARQLPAKLYEYLRCGTADLRHRAPRGRRGPLDPGPRVGGFRGLRDAGRWTPALCAFLDS